MQITDSGLYILEFFERFYSKPYICPAGYLTIGWGHIIKPSELFTEITKEEGLVLLRQDVSKAERAIIRYIKEWGASPQFDALVLFTFNVGAGALQRSVLRMKLNSGDYQAAADEFPKWCRANGKILRGLLRRRLTERNIFLKGEYQIVNVNV